MTYFTTKQLATAAGRKPWTIRKHVRDGHLKAEPKESIPGARGPRFSETNARKWLGRYYPERKLPTP